MNYVIGGNGQIGSEIINQLNIPKRNIIERHQYETWWDSRNLKRISSFLEENVTEDATIFLAAGITDPNVDPIHLKRMNIDLPINLVKVAQNLNIKICTFGTIQEEFKTRNNYLDSKRAMIEVLAGEIDRGYHLHLRLHTVYGARKPKYHMFLSKLSQAITSKTPFRMSSGLQLREFHHVTDDVRAIIAVNSSQVTGIEEINSGKEFRLRDFAAAILENYSLEHLLELNVFKDPVHENYKIRFPINRLTEKINFRDPVSGFIKHHDEINPDL